MSKQYIPIIGMEIHVEPKTESKMFCECPADFFGKEANINTCPVCLGLPGALPIPNKLAIDKCIKLGLILGCAINKISKFDRKNYFYPDLPKSYQISQYDLPFAYKGSFRFPGVDSTKESIVWDSIGITRVHMEEDTGKLSHQTVEGENVSLIDYNRSGVPLIEIVTEPDLRSAVQAKQFLRWLARTIEWAGISDCDMEKGTMRLEANISVAETEDGVVRALPQYKVEVKNVNSFRFIEKAIEYEIERHIELLKKGKIPPQETRGFAEDKGVTFSQRSKEDAKDYRYFPEPDIPPIEFSDRDLEVIEKQITMTPVAALEHLITSGVRSDYAEVLVQSMQGFTVFERVGMVLPKGMTKQDAAGVLINQKVDLSKFDDKEILQILMDSVRVYSMGENEVGKIVDEVIGLNVDQVNEYRAGKIQLLGFFVGKVMKETKGQADPACVNSLLLKKLN